MNLFEKIYQKSLRELLALESPTVKTYFKELNLIQNTTKREKLMNLLRRTAYKNISGAASSTGKYHPKFANGEFGLSRHTKAVVKFVTVICDAFPELNQDTMVIAAIAHDAFKYASDEEEYTAHDHAAVAANELEKAGFTDEARLVKSHMGRWPSDRSHGKVPKPEQFDEKMLHLADYIASKKFIDIKFNSENDLLEESLKFKI
jgi:hypothetical protein